MTEPADPADVEDRGEAGDELRGVRVGLLQARHGDVLAGLIARRGGEPVSAPCMREVRNVDDAALLRDLAGLADRPADVFVFQTGVGTQALLDAAAGVGVRERLLAGLAGTVVLARGPKPLGVLLRNGVRVDRCTAEPHTTAQVLPLLAGDELNGRRVAVQHHGARNRVLVEHLRGRGAEVTELFSYRWALPEDAGPVHRLLADLAAGRLAVTAFTSASQVENLLAIAGPSAPDVVDHLNHRTLVAAIGPTCAEALTARGVEVAIIPARPKMAPFVQAIATHVRPD